MSRFILLLLAVVILNACTGPINEKTVSDKPSGFLCHMLSSQYITLPSEQIAIYRELERRGEQCVSTQRVIIE